MMFASDIFRMFDNFNTTLHLQGKVPFANEMLRCWGFFKQK